ncbi:MAG: hypothetical protein F4X36_19805 [Gammaproteobacteria bacterium]|nr:hypothetical protein [Gammaproteobacteria bacterium]
MNKLQRQGIYLLAAGLLVGVAVIAVWPPDPTGVPPGTHAPADKPPAVERAPSAQPPPEPAAPTSTDTPLWQALDESTVPTLPDYAPEWSTEDRVLVRTSPAMAAAGGWRVGDRITLPVPQLGAIYRPLIEEIDDGPGGSRSVLGMIRGDDGRDRRYVVTVGPAHVFAYIDTPRGPYELSGGRELGWLLPTSSIMAGFDFSEPDYILPETAEVR